MPSATAGLDEYRHRSPTAECLAVACGAEMASARSCCKAAMVCRKASILRSPRRPQVQRMIAEADSLLRAWGFVFAMSARTWFYLRDILAWYPQFNKVRNEEVWRVRHDARPGRRPIAAAGQHRASAAKRRSGAAAVMDLLAVTGPQAAPACVKQLQQWLPVRRLSLWVGVFAGACVPGAGLHLDPCFRDRRHR